MEQETEMQSARNFRARATSWSLLLVGGSFALSFVFGCNASKPQICSAPQGTSTQAQALASADNAFAVGFFDAAMAGPASNLVMSPYSVSAVMTMVDVGAAGKTASQIESVLHLPSNGGSEAPAYAALACGTESHGSSDGNEIDIANSLWVQQGAAFKQTFTSVLERGYGSPLQVVDFEGNTAGATSSINAWISGKTQGKIPSLLGPSDVDAKTRLVLVSAIYFKGVWAKGFDPGQTASAPFTLSDGSQVSTPTMTGTVDLKLNGNASLTIVELPYKGGGLAMDILMPVGAGGLAAYEGALTPALLDASLAALSSAPATVLYLPKFSFTTRLELSMTLQSMGITDVFDPSLADLSGAADTMDLSVHSVVQEALVEVDEQGTVAAAATAASACSNCNAIIEPPQVHIDRPFLFLIRDTSNGSILFMGHVVNPAS